MVERVVWWFGAKFLQRGHRAEIKGEAIGEPPIRSQINMENWVIFKDIRMMCSISRVRFSLSRSECSMTSFDNTLVVLLEIAFTEMISSGSVMDDKNFKESPAVNKPVDACEEARS